MCALVLRSPGKSVEEGFLSLDCPTGEKVPSDRLGELIRTHTLQPLARPKIEGPEPTAKHTYRGPSTLAQCIMSITWSLSPAVGPSPMRRPSRA